MSIIVTGAAGFLGKKLVEKLLDNNYQIIAVVRRKKSIPNNLLNNVNITWIKCNLEKDLIKLPNKCKIYAAFHLAGATSGKYQKKKDFIKKNEITTKNFVTSVQKKTNRLIFASSQVVYGNPCSLNITEEFPIAINPSNYALSKIKSEKYIRQSQKIFKSMSIIMRLSGFIEGGGNVDYIIDNALNEKEILLYSKGKVRRDYLPVKYAIDIFFEALKLKYQSNLLVLNVGSGKALSSFEIANIVCDATNSKSKIRLSKIKTNIGDFALDIKKTKKIFKQKKIKIIDEIINYSKFKKNYEKNKYS